MHLGCILITYLKQFDFQETKKALKTNQLIELLNYIEKRAKGIIN